MNSNNDDVTIESAPFSVAQTQQILDALSHDLRGPIRQVTSFSQLLEVQLGPDVDAEAAEFLAHINDAASMARRKLDALSRLGSVVATKLNAESCLLAEVVDDALQRLEVGTVPAGRCNRVGADVVVHADRDLLVDVFAELIGNALKFCGSADSLRIESSHQAGRCQVTVADSGPGFEATDPMAAFDLFRRFHGSDYPGIGLGLTIVRTVLQRHGVEASITSTVSGTDVRFSLPLERRAG